MLDTIPIDFEPDFQKDLRRLSRNAPKIMKIFAAFKALTDELTECGGISRGMSYQRILKYWRKNIRDMVDNSKDAEAAQRIES